MQQTTNYELNKIELSDSPADITVINANWDKIDTELKTLSDDKFDKAGGTISGNTTVNGELTLTNTLKTNKNLVLASTVPIQKGVTPEQTLYSHWSVYDNQGFDNAANRLARLQYGLYNNLTAQVCLYVNRPNDAASEDLCGIYAQWTNGTTPRIAVTHNPDDKSNDKSVATTAWVKSLTATTTQYGLVRLASETDVLEEEPQTVMDVPLAYELNDFRRMDTEYVVGDKVNCVFKFEYYLECTQAGTTSNESLNTRNVTFGQEIEDGTAKWVVRAHVKSVGGKLADASGNVSIPAPTAITNEQIDTIVV